MTEAMKVLNEWVWEAKKVFGHITLLDANGKPENEMYTVVYKPAKIKHKQKPQQGNLF